MIVVTIGTSCLLELSTNQLLYDLIFLRNDKHVDGFRKQFIVEFLLFCTFSVVFPCFLSAGSSIIDVLSLPLHDWFTDSQDEVWDSIR